MKLGLKVNADADGFERLSQANPPFVEIWFNVNDSGRYNDLFEELKRRKCEAGLHFWGRCTDNIAPNLAYPDAKVAAETLALIKRTIDIAAANEFQYVNVHPGASALSKVNYADERYNLISESISTDRATQVFLAHAQELHAYAKKYGIVFTVETVPQRITRGWYTAETRLTPDTIYELPDMAIIQAARTGLWVANDVVHTAANRVSNDAHAIWQHLVDVSDALMSQTRLIHLGFLIPPYNGTDHHGSLTDPVFETSQAIPNKSQSVQLLKKFRNRPDIWILVEPKNDHVENYHLARNLIDQAAEN